MFVTAKLSPSDIIAAPFPHVVVRQAIDEDLCKRLIDELPHPEQFTRELHAASNERFNITAAEARQLDILSPSWKTFLGRHVSQAFLDQVVSLFARPLSSEYPEFLKRCSVPGKFRAGIRNVDTFDNADVLLDAQIGINTPVLGERSSVRGPHLDRPDKLFAGLLYLRHPDDRSTGGDLELYSSDCTRFDSQLHLPRDSVETNIRVPYQANTLVMFLNTPRSLHGVTPRSVTEFPRYFVNFVGTLASPLYEVDPPGSGLRSRISSWHRHSRDIIDRCFRNAGYR